MAHAISESLRFLAVTSVGGRPNRVAQNRVHAQSNGRGLLGPRYSPASRRDADSTWATSTIALIISWMSPSAQEYVARRRSVREFLACDQDFRREVSEATPRARASRIPHGMLLSST